MDDIFWGTGELLGDVLILGTPGQVISAIMVHCEPDGLPSDIARQARRESLAILIATVLQARLLEEPIASRTIDLTEITDADLERLTDPREILIEPP